MNPTLKACSTRKYCNLFHEFASVPLHFSLLVLHIPYQKMKSDRNVIMKNTIKYAFKYNMISCY